VLLDEKIGFVIILRVECFTNIIVSCDLSFYYFRAVLLKPTLNPKPNPSLTLYTFKMYKHKGKVHLPTISSSQHCTFNNLHGFHECLARNLRGTEKNLRGTDTKQTTSQFLNLPRILDSGERTRNNRIVLVSCGCCLLSFFGSAGLRSCEKAPMNC
jgi:hypothetical protein